MTAWRTASFCGHTECVEVAVGPAVVAVRDARRGPVLTFSPAAWAAFTARIRDEG